MTGFYLIYSVFNGYLFKHNRQAMQCVETGSQVCNVAWSKHSSELVSTHGYSFNQVFILSLQIMV
jgi:WD40 repeat protein